MNNPFMGDQNYTTMPYQPIQQMRNQLNPGPFSMAHGGNVSTYDYDKEYSGFDKFLHKYLPVITSFLGNMVGGPVGGMIGGGFGGAVSQRPNAKGDVNLGENILRGLGKGAITTGGMHVGSSLFGTPMPQIGAGSVNAGGSDILSKLFSRGPQTMITDPGQQGLQQMLAGRQGASGMLSQPQSSGMMGGLKELLGMQGPQPGTRGFYDEGGLLGGIAKGPLELALLATALGGKLGAREIPSNEPLPQFMSQAMTQSQEPPTKPIKYETLKRRVKRPPAGYRPGVDPEHQYFEAYAPGGYIGGETGGQDDKINAHVSDGEYVMDADSVAALGDGNNAAGARKLDKFRQGLRKHKRSASSNKIPPKAKQISSYMKPNSKGR